MSRSWARVMSPAVRLLNFNDVGAKPGEKLRAGRSRLHMCEIEDAHSLQCLRHLALVSSTGWKGGLSGVHCPRVAGPQLRRALCAFLSAVCKKAKAGRHECGPARIQPESFGAIRAPRSKAQARRPASSCRRYGLQFARLCRARAARRDEHRSRDSALRARPHRSTPRQR